ncbi:MAG TPA: hypothetical protein VH496_12745 [Mycobacterium sp.]|jgi:uncharacterized membrane protein HdeD (DUF308 family)
MVVLAVVLAVLGVVLIVAGIVYFANGAGVDAEGGSKGERVKEGFARVPYRDLLGLVPRSPKVITDSDASHRDRVMAAGAFAVLVGIVLLCLAVFAGIAAAL